MFFVTASTYESEAVKRVRAMLGVFRCDLCETYVGPWELYRISRASVLVPGCEVFVKMVRFLERPLGQ